jgi:addiction module RelB/DinJ family antitoxin
MPTVQVSTRVDESVKKAAQRVFERQGLDIASAMRIFLTKTANEQSIPLDISTSENRNLMLASEKSLSREWLLPEEDAAWATL